jgi:hypothetical protein
MDRDRELARKESGTGIETKALTRDETRIMQRYVWTMPLIEAWKHYQHNEESHNICDLYTFK